MNPSLARSLCSSDEPKTRMSSSLSCWLPEMSMLVRDWFLASARPMAFMPTARMLRGWWAGDGRRERAGRGVRGLGDGGEMAMRWRGDGGEMADRLRCSCGGIARVAAVGSRGDGVKIAWRLREGGEVRAHPQSRSSTSARCALSRRPWPSARPPWSPIGLDEIWSDVRVVLSSSVRAIAAAPVGPMEQLQIESSTRASQLWCVVGEEGRRVVARAT